MDSEEDETSLYYFSEGDYMDRDDDVKSQFDGEGEFNYTILTESDIRLQIEEAIREVSTVFSLSKNDASTLLRHHNWTAGKVYDALLADESGVRKRVGLLEKPAQGKFDPSLSSENSSEEERCLCGICFESYPSDSIESAACGHPFCGDCWRLYIKTNVTDGLGCLILRCPKLSCLISVTDEMNNELAFQEDKKKYHRFLVRSYV